MPYPPCTRIMIGAIAHRVWLSVYDKPIGEKRIRRADSLAVPAEALVWRGARRRRHLNHQHATIDVNRFAGDIAATVGHKEYREIGEFRMVAHAPKRDRIFR